MNEQAEVTIEMYDKCISGVDWLQETSLPVAITLTEVLQPSEGKAAIIFPPTFAADKKAPHPYQIDVLRPDIPAQAAKLNEEVNNCLIDSIGSQANRMEPWFRRPPLSKLVPQIEVKLKTKVDDKETIVKVNLLDVGHRIADGAVRFSGLRDKVTVAIKAMMNEANAAKLVELAPTSLIFGFWDSRPDTTMFKHGRLLRSEIRATNVAIVKRSAQFNPAFDPALIGLADEVPEATEESPGRDEDSGRLGDGKDPLSKLGLRAAPAVNTHGGIRVYGEIVRRTQISLVGLRALAVTKKTKANGGLEIATEETLALRRYILGLSLVAARCQPNYALREGCLLVRAGEPEARLVYNNQAPETFDWSLQQVFAYAQKAAEQFSGKSQCFDFDKKRAKDEVEKLKKEKGKSRKSK